MNRDLSPSISKSSKKLADTSDEHAIHTYRFFTALLLAAIYDNAGVLTLSPDAMQAAYDHLLSTNEEPVIRLLESADGATSASLLPYDGFPRKRNRN
jgi:hypothetical protein